MRVLGSYILNNGWIDKEEGKIPTYEQILQEVRRRPHTFAAHLIMS
jgi:hypothetical protein